MKPFYSSIISSRITKHASILTLLAIHCFQLFAQSISINNDGTAPHPIAMLDVKSSTKGFLLPRMDSTARKNISSPAKGLMVFDTSDNNLWQFANSVWSSQLKLPGLYHFNENSNDVLSITNDGIYSPIYANCTYGGGTGIESHGGRYGLFGKGETGGGAQSCVGVVGSYYAGFQNNYSTGGIGVAGYGAGAIGPSFSLNAYHFGVYASAKDYGIYATAPTTGIAGLFKGQTWIQGTQYVYHFNYGGNEDAYIRGGEDNAIVVIADEPGQKGTVGTGTQNEDAKLTVDDPNSTLYSGLNATSNGIKKDTVYFNDGPPSEFNDHRPAVKAIGAYGGNALEVDGQVAVSGNNPFVFTITPQNDDPNSAGYTVQNGSFWEIRLNHTILDDPLYSNAGIFVTPYVNWTLSSSIAPVMASRQILWRDISNGMYKWFLDINPFPDTQHPQLRLYIMVIRQNPCERVISPSGG